MPDREKVIKGLVCCGRLFPDDYEFGDDGNCTECPYSKPDGFCGKDDLFAEAVALLREQEPQEPFYCEAEDSWGCGNCGETVGYGELNPGGIDPVRNKYCPNCGRAVKWDD